MIELSEKEFTFRIVRNLNENFKKLPEKKKSMFHLQFINSMLRNNRSFLPQTNDRIFED